MREVLRSLYAYSLLAGHYSGCHQRDDRSFHFGIRKFPACARCTGITIGLCAGLLLSVMGAIPSLPLLIATLVPMCLDGIIQLMTDYESTNIRRLITGILFGTSAVLIVTTLFFS